MGGVEAASGGLARPNFYALVADQIAGFQVGGVAGEFVGGSAGGHRQQAVGIFAGELHGYRAAHGFADQMNAPEAEVVQQPAEVGGKAAQRPAVAFGRHGGAAEAAGVKPDYAVLAGQQGHPSVPEAGVFGVAVMQHHGLGTAPRVGEIVIVVVQIQRVIDAGVGHKRASLGFPAGCRGTGTLVGDGDGDRYAGLIAVDRGGMAAPGQVVGQ